MNDRELMAEYDRLYTWWGLVLALPSVVVGLLLLWSGLAHGTYHAEEALGLHSGRVVDSAPGGTLALVAVVLLWVTRPRVPS